MIPPSASRKKRSCSPAGLRVGLHAQTLHRADGVVAGSEITTLGLKKAFERRGEIHSVTRYGPGNYRNLDRDDLDLLVIEGWDATLPRFIQRVRKHHRRAKILFWNLSFWGIREVARLPVDGYLTNSKKMVPLLERIAPTRFLMLAADPEEFRPVEPRTRYSHPVVYLGMFHPGKSPATVERMLYEALEYGLAVYGNGWGEHPVLKRCWKGRLPTGDIAALYSSADIVLGMTEKRQKIAGMVNNRVFEALSCGACLVCDYYPGLEKLFGDAILYSRKQGDTSRHIETLLGDASYRRALGAGGRERILRHHTYDHRVERILDFY